MNRRAFTMALCAAPLAALGLKRQPVIPTDLIQIRGRIYVDRAYGDDQTAAIHVVFNRRTELFEAIVPEG